MEILAQTVAAAEGALGIVGVLRVCAVFAGVRLRIINILYTAPPREALLRWYNTSMFVSPLQVLDHLPTPRGARIADFGAGSGDYSFPLLDRLKGEGSVYAFDFLPGVVESLQRESARRNSENFFALCVDLNRHIPLKDSLLHCAVLANTLHAIDERQIFLSELHRVLRASGFVLYVDWAASFHNIGPTTERVLPPGEAARLFRSEGFQVGSMLPAGSHHYAFIATKV